MFGNSAPAMVRRLRWLARYDAQRRSVLLAKMPLKPIGQALKLDVGDGDALPRPRPRAAKWSSDPFSGWIVGSGRVSGRDARPLEAQVR